MAQLNPFERSLPGGFSDQGKAHLGFLDLPFDIRRIIYDLCLTTPEAIAIHLGRNRSHIANAVKKPSNPNFNTKFLRACKVVYEEGTVVMYTKNVFRFEGSRVVDALISFEERLTDENHDRLRNIDLQIPPFKYRSRDGRTKYSYHISNLSHVTKGLTDTIFSFAGLKNLTLNVIHDLLPRDLAYLHYIGESTEAKITLDVDRHGFDYFPTMIFDNENRVHGEVLAKLKSLGWTVAGHRLVIDERHRLWDETRMIAELLELEDSDYGTDSDC